jgi:hypothetical protein
VSKKQGTGVSLNKSIKMNQKKSPRKASALQIAGVAAFIGKIRHLALVSGL